MIETMTGEVCLKAFTAAAHATAEAMSISKKPRREVDATSLYAMTHDRKNTGQKAELDLPELVPMNLVRTNGGTQARVTIDETVVQDYADALEEGAKLPAVVVYYDEGADVYWLADGFHRFEAHRVIGRVAISAFVKDGTLRDAKLHAAGANGTHGLQRTNADKRCAVMMLLEDPEWVQWSDRKIARQCGVGNKFVGDVRASICVPNTDSPASTSEQPVVPSTRTVTRNGTTYEQKVKTKLTANPKPSNLTELAPADTEPTIAMPESEQRIANSEPETDTPSKNKPELVHLRAENAKLRDRVEQLTRASKNPQLKYALADAQAVNALLNERCVELTSRIAELEKENEVLVQRLGMQGQKDCPQQQPDVSIDDRADDVLMEPAETAATVQPGSAPQCVLTDAVVD